MEDNCAEKTESRKLTGDMNPLMGNNGFPRNQYQLTCIPSTHIAPRETKLKAKSTKKAANICIRYITSYNLACEYVNTYNICQILDRGVYPVNWTSYRLRNETIYFDTASKRFELKRYNPKNPTYLKKNCFCLSVVKMKYIMTRALMKQGKIPLPDYQVTVCEDHLSWTDIIWGTTKLTIRGRKNHCIPC